MGIRDEQASKTKIKIIESAKELIEDYGIDKVSVDDITKHAGVAKGSFYVYFKKKEDIINEIGCMEFRYISEELNKMNTDIVSKLEFYFKKYKESVTCLGVEISKSWLLNNLNCRCKLEYDYNTISNLINSAINNKEIKNNINVSEITYKIISVLYGLMLIWIMSNGSLKYDVDDYGLTPKEILNPYLEVEDERI